MMMQRLGLQNKKFPNEKVDANSEMNYNGKRF